MNEIKQAIVESGDRVVASEETVRAAEQRITAIGERMGGITGRMQSLADLLGQQRTATNDISKSGGKIASKAKKVRNEIKGSIERMLESEASAGAAIDTFDGRAVTHYELIRVKADLAVWVRTLAATLLVLVEPDPGLSDRGLARLARWCDTAGTASVRAPAFLALRAAKSKARAEARRLIEASSRRIGALRPRPIWRSRSSRTRSSNIATNWWKPRSFSHPPQFLFRWRARRTQRRRTPVCSLATEPAARMRCCRQARDQAFANFIMMHLASR